MKKSFFGLKLILVIVLLILTVILILQNLNIASIQVFFWGFSAPVIAVILVSLLIGFLLGLLVLSFVTGKKKGKGQFDRRPDLSDDRPEKASSADQAKQKKNK